MDTLQRAKFNCKVVQLFLHAPNLCPFTMNLMRVPLLANRARAYQRHYRTRLSAVHGRKRRIPSRSVGGYKVARGFQLQNADRTDQSGADSSKLAPITNYGYLF